MKLHATVTSERATTRLEGNEYISIDLFAFDRENPIGNIVLEVMEDAEGNGKQWLLTWKATHREDRYILQEGHAETGIIGEEDGEIKAK